VDIVHHAIIGGIGYTALSGSGHEIAGIGFMAGSVFPDMDVALMAFGKRAYLKSHQGPTHSLILSPLFALLIAYLLTIPFGFTWIVVSATLMGIWLHSLLDYMNTYGVCLLWPLNKKKYSLDAVFFIDIVSWIITAGFFAGWYFYGFIPAIYVYLLLFGGYELLKLVLQRNIKAALQCKFAIPSSINPFEFYILENDGNSIKTYLYNVLTKKTGRIACHNFPSDKYVKLASKSRIFKDMLKIAKYLYITDAYEDHEGITIIARDIATRNFGGKFGRTTLKFNKDGELIYEMANI
jgi:inner membrane protein